VGQERDVGELLAAERAVVVRRLGALEREFGSVVESAGSAAGTDDEHDPEGATVAFERQHLAALISQAREHLAQIDAAIRRVAEGSYGVCGHCGRPIAEARLAARPAAATCIACASGR
jgi:DnaK suppressor protein